MLKSFSMAVWSSGLVPRRLVPHPTGMPRGSDSSVIGQKLVWSSSYETSAIGSKVRHNVRSVLLDTDFLPHIDPILGLTSIELSTAFSDACQLSRTYPIMGGLGWGSRESVKALRGAGL